MLDQFVNQVSHDLRTPLTPILTLLPLIKNEFTNIYDEKLVLISLPVSKTQLASNLGTTSETLSRTFRKLSDDEIISVQGREIEILDTDRLVDLAASYKES